MVSDQHNPSYEDPPEPGTEVLYARLPAGMVRDIRERAQREGRSMAAVVLHMLEGLKPPAEPAPPTTRCKLCDRVREITKTTAHCGIYHARHRSGFREEQIYFDWLCGSCIHTKSLIDYFGACYGTDYVQAFLGPASDYAS